MQKFPPAQRDPRAVSEEMLLAGAQRWAHAALDAWVDDEQPKVGLMAPMALEMLGKAALWRENPVLLIQLHDRHEAAFFQLATRPDLSATGVRTIGLQGVLSRLVSLLGSLPVPKKSWEHIAQVRNGAVHVGASDNLGPVLLDCLTIIDALLEQLGIEREDFYGRHHEAVDSIIDRRQTEISLLMVAKLAKARAEIERLENKLGTAEFARVAEELEKRRFAIDVSDYVNGGGSVDEQCPACGLLGRLLGDVELVGDIDYYVETSSDGAREAVPMPSWQAMLAPFLFVCSVCGLQVNGTQELAEAGLPNQSLDVTDEQLGSSFDVATRIEETMYDFSRNRYDDSGGEYQN